MSYDSSRSAASGSKSKRSFNSISSNPSSKGSKKTKISGGQKTLGTAWGANSRSSSKSSFQNSPFSDFGSYMAVKNKKLQEQFDAAASISSDSKSNNENLIFRGVSIFVDGFTVPSSQELKAYMLKYGGRFENYFSRRRVTHIICSNLPDSKVKNLRSFSGGLPVVKPSWVLDSVVANRLLSWIPYQLDQLVSEVHKQPKLSAFFSMKKNSLSDDSTTDPVEPEIEDPSLDGGTAGNLSEPSDPTEYTRAGSGEWDGSTATTSRETVEPALIDGNFSDGSSLEPSDVALLNKSSAGVQDQASRETAEPALIDGNCSGRNSLEPSDVARLNKISAGVEDQTSPSRPSIAVNSYKANNPTSSAISGSSSKHHSTLVDPNFVENYFKSSRLHFIGTWRNRYRKRFANFKGTSSTSSASAQGTSVIHVDMDCFFVSVVIRSKPELRDKPVAVSHSDNPRGTAEISSANYPARGYGIRAGIFVRDAKALCPHLVILPYDFQAYEEVADQFYNILHKYCNKVQAVSCDEAFLDVTDSEVQDPQLLASIIRKEIFDTTGCTASCGIAENLLVARLATRSAKPDGQCYIPSEKVDDYMNDLPIKALPGIGHVLEEKLKRRQVQTCGQLRMISKEALQKDFGTKTGDMLWSYSRGVDNRLVGVIQETKSVGAEVNWGVRFNELKDCQHFLTKLCKEVSLRLQGCAVHGRTFTLKIKKRKSDKEPVKYMGCGDCDNFSHSMTVPMATDDVDVIQRIATQLLGHFHIDIKDIRGMGLQVSKLESVDTLKQGNERSSIRSWLTSTTTTSNELCNIRGPAKESSSKGHVRADSALPSVLGGTSSSNAEASRNQDTTLPPLGDLDLAVVESLPPDLFSEINNMYGGKLSKLISKKKGKSTDFGVPIGNASLDKLQVDGDRSNFFRGPACVTDIPVEEKEDVHQHDAIQSDHVHGADSPNVVTPLAGRNGVDLMPSSLSQIDNSVLQQLPEELRVDILELLPAHRSLESAPGAASGSTSKAKESACEKCPENQIIPPNSVLRKELLVGNPPSWVQNFEDSSFPILNILASMYYKSGSNGSLSSVLQRTLSESQDHTDSSNDGWHDAICSVSDLLEQYIKLVIETDIEEIYLCFRLLRRLSLKSKFFLEICNLIVPLLQGAVGENYGGSLHLSLGKDQ